MDKLIVTLKLMLRDPSWNPIYGEDRKCLNMDKYYTVIEKQCEILTVHFEKKTMRVRFMHMGKKETRDVSNAEFTRLFDVVAKTV